MIGIPYFPGWMTIPKDQGVDRPWLTWILRGFPKPNISVRLYTYFGGDQALQIYGNMINSSTQFRRGLYTHDRDSLFSRLDDDPQGPRSGSTLAHMDPKGIPEAQHFRETLYLFWRDQALQIYGNMEGNS